VPDSPLRKGAAGGMRGFRAYLRELLLLDEPPARTALTYSLGVFIGFSPFLGFHTLIALLVIVLFRVNRLAILAGVYTNTPWTLAPAATLGTALGFWLLGTEGSFPAISRARLASADFRHELFSDIAQLLTPFVVGNLVLGAALGLLAYFVAKPALVRYRRKYGSGTVPGPRPTAD
jgi:uncharacterized protein